MNASASVIERQLDEAFSACTHQNTPLTALRRTVPGLVLQSERPLTADQLHFGVCHALEDAESAKSFMPSSTIVEIEGTCGACAKAA